MHTSSPLDIPHEVVGKVCSSDETFLECMLAGLSEVCEREIDGLVGAGEAMFSWTIKIISESHWNINGLLRGKAFTRFSNMTSFNRSVRFYFLIICFPEISPTFL